MAIPETRKTAEVAGEEALLGAGEVVDKLVRTLADKRKFPNEQINHFMSRVVTEALGTEDEWPTSPWFVVAVDGDDFGLNTAVNIDRSNKYLVVSAGFSQLKQVAPETAKMAIADFIYQTTMWFTHGNKYSPTLGPRKDWAESRKQHFLSAVAKKPQLINELLNSLPAGGN